MIIGLSGYAKSGKDEVGKIICNLNHKFRIRKFSDKLKMVASILTGHHDSEFDDQDFKDSNLSMDWFVWSYKLDVTGTDVEPKYNGTPELRPMTVREFLQKLGTDAIRHGLHENTWVNALMADYRVEDSVLRFDGNVRIDIPKSYWVITDTRFLNEADAIKERGGYVIRIDRPGVGPVNKHKSETELDHYQFDYRISNDGDLKDLKAKVKTILNDIDGKQHPASAVLPR